SRSWPGPVHHFISPLDDIVGDLNGLPGDLPKQPACGILKSDKINRRIRFLPCRRIVSRILDVVSLKKASIVRAVSGGKDNSVEFPSPSSAEYCAVLGDGRYPGLHPVRSLGVFSHGPDIDD